MKTKFVYIGIRVKNLQASIKFYTTLLGMKVGNRHKMEETKGEIVNLTSEEGGFTLELNYYEKESPYYTDYRVGEGLDHLAFQVDNLDQALEEAKAVGHPPILELTSGNMRWAYIEDPNGIWIELF